jgi:TolB protein
VRGQQLLGQSKVVLAGDLRLAAHRVADEVHEKLTGERGVFATRIAYVLHVGKRYELQVTDADGEGGQIALTSPEPVISPAWSPDGRELAVTLSQDGLAQLYTLPAAGGAPTRLTNSAGIDTEAVYSPDGRQIYFVSDRGGGPQVYRLPTVGGVADRVTFAGNYNISPAISPDGKLLAFISRLGGGYKLMTQDLDSGTVQSLTDTQDDESPSFAPSGRLLVYATKLRGADVLMTTTLDGKIKTRLLSSGADMREPAWGPFGR